MLQVRDPGFLDLLGLSPKIVEFVKTDAHEGAVWYPDQNELYFSSNRIALANGGSRADVSKSLGKFLWLSNLMSGKLDLIGFILLISCTSSRR